MSKNRLYVLFGIPKDALQSGFSKSLLKISLKNIFLYFLVLKGLFLDFCIILQFKLKKEHICVLILMSRVAILRFTYHFTILKVTYLFELLSVSKFS